MPKVMSHSLTVRSGFLLSLVTLLACMALSGCADKPKLPRLGADASILAFGDSLTYGTGANDNESYPAVLGGLIGRKVINAGVPGETSSDGLARLPRVLEDTQPALVILCLGGNDFLRKLDPQQTRANLERMISMIQANRIPLILIAVPQMRLFGGSDPLYGELAEKHRVLIEDDMLADILHDRDLKSDPIHPNAAGYRLMADALAAMLKKSGAI